MTFGLSFITEHHPLILFLLTLERSGFCVGSCRPVAPPPTMLFFFLDSVRGQVRGPSVSFLKLMSPRTSFPSSGPG